jgi:hypothetical protein
MTPSIRFWKMTLLLSRCRFGGDDEVIAHAVDFIERALQDARVKTGANGGGVGLADNEGDVAGAAVTIARATALGVYCSSSMPEDEPPAVSLMAPLFIRRARQWISICRFRRDVVDCDGQTMRLLPELGTFPIPIK